MLATFFIMLAQISKIVSLRIRVPQPHHWRYNNTDTRRDTSFSLVRPNEQWLSKDTTPLSDNQSRHLRTTLSLRTIPDGPDAITTGATASGLRGYS